MSANVHLSNNNYPFLCSTLFLSKKAMFCCFFLQGKKISRFFSLNRFLWFRFEIISTSIDQIKFYFHLLVPNLYVRISDPFFSLSKCYLFSLLLISGWKSICVALKRVTWVDCRIGENKSDGKSFISIRISIAQIPFASTLSLHRSFSFRKNENVNNRFPS